jgi:hypothetical protein
MLTRVLTRDQVARAQAYMVRVAKGEVEGVRARELRVMGTSGDEPVALPVFTSLAVLDQDEEARLAVEAAQVIIDAKRSRGMTVRGVPADGGPDAAFVVAGDYDPTLDAEYVITSMITGG